MAGFDNEVMYSIGERLQPSTSQAITLMQKTASDVSNINFTGNPEGLVSANPSSVSHDPVSGNFYLKQTGFGTTGWIQISTIETPSTKITIYNLADTGTTWTKDAKSQVIEVFAWAGGGGAGSGRKGTTTASGGGGGGGPSGFAFYKAPASFFNATETVTIGDGGTGGNAQTTDANDGNPGNPGNVTTFGNIKALPGNFGLGGTTLTANGGSNLLSSSFNVTPAVGSGAGQGRNTTGASGTNIGQINGFSSLPTAGGGGGGANTLSQQQGGSGGNLTDIAGVILLAGGTFGLESTGINGGNGNPALSTGGVITGGTGGGGGGGYSVGASGATSGGTGGNGAIPGGGGGGGGAGIDSVANSGAGGNGAAGRIIVIEYF